MSTLKIASKFLTKSQAAKEAIKQRQLLKSEGKSKLYKVEVLFAFELWRTNKWFNQKKFGLKNPTDQDYILIITEIKQPSAITKTEKAIKPQSAKRMIATPKKKSPKKSKEKQAPIIKMQGAPIQPATYVVQMLPNTRTYKLLSVPLPSFYHSVA